MGSRRRRRRRSSPRRGDSHQYSVDGRLLWHGVPVGQFWKTDMQVAIYESNCAERAAFSTVLGKNSTSPPYVQYIPMDFATEHTHLNQQSVTLEGPTGKTWTVFIRPLRLPRFCKSWYFGKGWREFSVDNHFRKGYRLLFTLVESYRFTVEFFDPLSKRCISYPPLPAAQPGSLPNAQPRHQAHLQPGSRPASHPEVAEGPTSHRRGSEGQTSAAVPRIGATLGLPILLEPSDLGTGTGTGTGKGNFPENGPEMLPKTSFPLKHAREQEEHTFGARRLSA